MLYGLCSINLFLYTSGPLSFGVRNDLYHTMNVMIILDHFQDSVLATLYFEGIGELHFYFWCLSVFYHIYRVYKKEYPIRLCVGHD